MEHRQHVVPQQTLPQSRLIDLEDSHGATYARSVHYFSYSIATSLLDAAGANVTAVLEAVEDRVAEALLLTAAEVEAGDYQSDRMLVSCPDCEDQGMVVGEGGSLVPCDCPLGNVVADGYVQTVDDDPKE